jgi:hypothetical protein
MHCTVSLEVPTTALQQGTLLHVMEMRGCKGVWMPICALTGLPTMVYDMIMTSLPCPAGDPLDEIIFHGARPLTGGGSDVGWVTGHPTAGALINVVLQPLRMTKGPSHSMVAQELANLAPIIGLRAPDILPAMGYVWHRKPNQAVPDPPP